MLKGEVIDISSKTRYNISFFDDDSVDTIRQRISSVVDIHPDRLLTLIGLKLPESYYTEDPRHWEALFDRLSYNGEPLEKDVFNEYQKEYRSPNLSMSYRAYDKAEWMSRPESLESLFEPTQEFIEYRVFGVEEKKSFILPLEITNGVTSKIPAVNLPVPEITTLFKSLYTSDQFVRFIVRPYDERAEAVKSVYYPFLVDSTPQRLSEESIRLLQKTTKQLQDLLSLPAPEPSSITIIRTRFYIPWVETDFGSAIRTRFEQIFYGLTVSKDVPYIGYFTSKDQVSRHKFFTEDSKSKKPYLDMSTWNSWWSSTRPVRNIPTLILYRGKTNHHFDRIAITAGDMVVSTHRPEGNTETLDELQKETFKWIQELDAVVPFISKGDLNKSRWELQDMSFLAKYKDKIDDFDLLRFNCLSSVFDIRDKTKSQFSLLRTDHSNNGISAIEVKLLQMMKEGRSTPDEVSLELSIPIQNARELIRQIEIKLDEDPRIADKAFRGYPTFKVGPDFVITSAVSDLDEPVKYSSILRYVLSNPDSDKLDAICPKRMERVTVETSIAPATTLEVDAALAEEYGDLFGYLEQEEDIPAEEVQLEEEPQEVQKIQTDQKQSTTYGYFKTRLEKFDPETFNFPGSTYPKECEQKRQPIILSSKEITRLSGTPYNINEYPENRRLDTTEPDGTIVCPDYWCMRDQIPIQESQLDRSNGDIRCPVCHGKLQTRSSDDPRVYPLIKRETGFLYPGYVDYFSPLNQKQLPCCFKKPRSKTAEKETEDKYYILGETKVNLKPLRVAFLSPTLIQSLQLGEVYEGITRRIQNAMSGFFRVGIGRPSENLPTLLGLKTKIEKPRNNIPAVLKCSFLNTWRQTGEKHLDAIESALSKIQPYDNCKIVLDSLTKLISGFDEAYEKGTLSVLQELEYCAITLQSDVFRIHRESNSVGCLFYSSMMRPRTRAIIILQQGDEIDILSHVVRMPRGFEFNSNIYQKPFKKTMTADIEKLRNEACKTDVPSFNDALNVMQKIEVDDFSVILDPFGKGQAFFKKDEFVIPFRSTSIPDMVQTKLVGYGEVDPDHLPEIAKVKSVLESASQINKGYGVKEHLFNSSGQVVELLTSSGLRIPIKPVEMESKKDSEEVVHTIMEESESKLVFGEPSEDLKEKHDAISYSSEVYEFMLFQLSHDIQTDNLELRNALLDVAPKRTTVEPLLRSWFQSITEFMPIRDAKEFVSKIRSPCSKDSCSGTLCGMVKGVCKAKISSSIDSEKLFHRLLSTLLDNVKIRSVVLDGRTTPFFSTVLYLELPHEVILTDLQLP